MTYFSCVYAVRSLGHAAPLGANLYPTVPILQLYTRGRHFIQLTAKRSKGDAMRINGRNPGPCCSSSSPSSSTVLVLPGETEGWLEGRGFGLVSEAQRARTASVLRVVLVDDWLVMLNLLNRDGDDRDRFLSPVSACPMISRQAGGGVGDGGGGQRTSFCQRARWRRRCSAPER